MKIFSALLLCLALGAVAYADEDTHAASDCAKAHKEGRACTLVFQVGDRVDGQRPSAGGERIAGEKPITFSNLIKVRTSFRERIIRSTDRL